MSNQQQGDDYSDRSIAIGTSVTDSTVVSGDNNTITVTNTKIIQISVDEIKTRELITTSPYKGLKKFEPEDTHCFFGRDQSISGLVNELEQTNFVLLLGASGSGKSSVVRAGLIPWLQQKWGKHFVSLILTPDRDPFESLYGSLLSRGFNQSQAQVVRAGKANATDALSQMVKTLKTPEAFWLILIDQFEELFTVSEHDKRDRFITNLVRLSKDRAKDPRLKIVATMRADFLDQLDPAPAHLLARITDQHRPLITQMYPDELRQAIEQPAAHHGVVFETGLVEEIIKDVQGQAGCLPLLQYTLDLLWETEVQDGGILDRTLNISSYRRLGGVRGALQQRVDQIYQELSSAQQLATQRIFLKLVEIGGDEAVSTEWQSVRRRANRSEFTDQAEQTVLTQLIDANLLVIDAPVTGSETHPSKVAGATVEIAHEILLTSWPMLNTWIQENRQSIALRNRLNDDVMLWQAKKADSDLWSGSKLAQVVELRSNPEFKQVLGGFSDSANQFIDASVGWRDRQRRRVMAGLSLFSFAALTLSGFALYQWRNSELNQADSLGRYSQSLFSGGKELEASVQAIKAGRILQEQHATDLEVRRALQETIYEGSERNRLEGHNSPVFSVSFSPDGKTLATGSADKTVKLWNVESGQLIRTLQGHQSFVNSVSFSPDGKTLATGSADNTVKLWNVETGQLIRTLQGHDGYVNSVSFSPDGKTLATGNYDNVKLWSVETGQPIRTLQVHDGYVNSVSFSPDGKTLATGNYHNVKLWSVETGQLIRTLQGHQSFVNSVNFSTDGKTLATGNDDKTVKLWNVETGQLIRILQGHDDKVNSVSFSPDGKTLVTVSNDHTIKLWNVKTGQLIHTLRGHNDYVFSVSFSPDGKTLATGSADHTIKLWNVETDQEFRTLTGHDNSVKSVSFSPDGKTLATGSKDNTVKLWNVETGQLIYTLPGTYPFFSVSFSPDGKILAIGSGDNTIKLWNMESGQLYTLKGHDGYVNSVSFSPDGKTLASGSADHTIKLWNVETGQELRTLKGHDAEVNSVSFSPDGKILASGSYNHTIKLWNVETGQELRTLKGHDAEVNSVSFSPDGKTLASGSGDNTIKLWNVESGQLIRTLKGHDSYVFSVSFSPDGKTLASGSGDNTIKLWNVESGQELRTLKGHDNYVWSVSFSPDGKTLASGSGDKTIKLWTIDLTLDSNLDLAPLVGRSCDRVRSYLVYNPQVSESDKHLCD